MNENKQRTQAQGGTRYRKSWYFGSLDLQEDKTPWVHDIDHIWFLFVTSENEMELGQALGISILSSKKDGCAWVLYCNYIPAKHLVPTALAIDHQAPLVAACLIVYTALQSFQPPSSDAEENEPPSTFW